MTLVADDVASDVDGDVASEVDGDVASDVGIEFDIGIELVIEYAVAPSRLLRSARSCARQAERRRVGAMLRRLAG